MAVTGASQINVTNHVAVAPLTAAAAVCNFLSQIWQPDIGAEALNQNLFPILTDTPALRARQAHHISGIFVKAK